MSALSAVTSTTDDVAENLGRFLVWTVQARGMIDFDFGLIPTVKMETRHPVERYESSSIYNHCGVMAA